MEPLPPGDEEENLTVPGEEVEPEPPGSEQPPGDEDTAAAAAVDPTASVAGYGYPYAGYGAQYADPSYDYQAYYNSYYYPQGQGYGAQPPSSAGYYTGYEGYQQYDQQVAEPGTSAPPTVEAATSSAPPDLPPQSSAGQDAGDLPEAPAQDPESQPTGETGQESYVMGANVQVVSLTEEQRAAAERQRQALEAARLAAEAQVQREQEERRRREEEAQRQRNLAAQRAAQAAAAEKAAKKDAGPSPEVLAEIQKKLEEAQILTAKNTAAAAEEAAKKEAEANQLAKKKGMQTLQGAKLAFVKPGIVAPVKRSDSNDIAATSVQPPMPTALAEPAPEKETPKAEAQRAVIMQRLAAMKAAKPAPTPAPVVPPPVARRPSIGRSRSPSGSSVSRSSSPGPARNRRSPSSDGSPQYATRRLHSVHSGRRSSLQHQYNDDRSHRRHDSGNHRDASDRRSSGRRPRRSSVADYDHDYDQPPRRRPSGHEEAPREPHRSKDKKRKEKQHRRRHRHRQDRDAEAGYQDADYAQEQPPRSRRGHQTAADYGQYYDDQDQVAGAAQTEVASAAFVARENSGVRPATVAPALPSTAPATLPAPEPVAAKPAIKSPPKLAELRARISGAAAPARQYSSSSGSESESPSPPPQRPVQQAFATPAAPYGVHIQPQQPPAAVQVAPYAVAAQPAVARPPPAPAPPPSFAPAAAAAAAPSAAAPSGLPAQVKEAAAAALARRQAEAEATQRKTLPSLQDRASDAAIASSQPLPQAGALSAPAHRQYRHRPAVPDQAPSRSRKRDGGYQEYDYNYAAPGRHASQEAPQDDTGSEGGHRHRERKKRRKDSKQHRDKKQHKRRRRSPSISSDEGARPPARANGWEGDRGTGRRPGYFQHDDRMEPEPQRLSRRSSDRHRGSSRRGRSFTPSRSPSSSRSRSRSPSRPRPPAYARSRSRSPSPASKARAQAEADERAQKLAAEVARAATAARLAADANSNLAATRPARKIYVGSLPVASSEAEITHFFNQMMVAAKATTPNMPGQPVLSCYINHEKRFAFVEFRTVEEASNAMALDGLGYRGETLRIRRPSDYNSLTMAHLGPTQPSAAVNAGLIGLSSMASGAPALADKPAPPAEQAEPASPAAPPAPPPPAPAALAAAPAEPPSAPPAQAAQPAVAASGELPAATAPPAAPAPAAGRSSVLRLANMVSRDELAVEEEYDDIRDDIYWEIRDKYGAITSIILPRPGAAAAEDPPGVGMVFVAFEEAANAAAAQAGLHRRKFGENRVVADFYDQQLFAQGIYQ